MTLKLKFFNSDSFGSLKASIHYSGKLGFSESAIKRLNINNNMSALIAKNDEDETDESFYMILQEPAQETAFKFNKAGDYYSLNTKALFDNLGIEYRKKSIRFDIVETEYEGKKIYKLLKREGLRKTES